MSGNASQQHEQQRQRQAHRSMASRQLIQADAAGQTPVICPSDEESITARRESARAKIKKQSTEYIVKTGIAGGLAGCAAKTVVGPLDRVKILFQTSNPQFAKYTGSWLGVLKAMRSIYSDSGSRGLFRGHSATLLRIFPYAGIKFVAYEQVRAFMIRDQSQETPVRRFLSGSIAGCVSVLLTYPLEVIRVRLAFDTTRGGRISLARICKEIYNESVPSSKPVHLKSSPLPGAAIAAATTAAQTVQQLAPRTGLSNFYRGFTPTLWGMLPYAGSSFLTHDTAQDWLRNPSISKWTTLPGSAKHGKRPLQLKTWAQLVAGGIAGFVSQTASYPLEVIRRRMQVGGVVGDGRRVGMVEVANRIFRERGWRGFWVGLTIGYVKVVPMAATSFYVYERGKFYLGV